MYPSFFLEDVKDGFPAGAVGGEKGVVAASDEEVDVVDRLLDVFRPVRRTGKRKQRTAERFITG